MSANLKSIEALRAFRASLIQFIEDASSALQSMGMELQKSREWIEHDRPQYWTIQTRRAFDLVSQTRTAYETCRMRTVAGHRPSCLEEKEAYNAAQRRVRNCQEQIEHVKRWANKLQHETDEFRGRFARLQMMLESELPKAVARLDRLASILESYAEMDAPPPKTDQSK
ncbi:hypothetical protein KOR42_42170 [Thalassoglobus neptunius]|uniref:Uncharacterized protein n=1 Tax=Thalassoglobus neptunius TaxID=1938619 RepID=A0A5C5W9Y9_9PLAN|nr:hypothetical protein [Thalassoglobus neptunius]TWT47103.1 hypothetical protein KOR42_42170 [Thalassoglobus neptunius]